MDFVHQRFRENVSRNPGLVEVLDKIIASTWKAPVGAGYNAEIQRTVNMVVLVDDGARFRRARFESSPSHC